MAGMKYTRTQEKQYGAWIAYPGVGFQVPGSSIVTDKERPWLLATPLGIRAVSTAELEKGFHFKTGDSMFPFNTLTAKAKMVNGKLDWTPAVRNTAHVPRIMARHLPSSANNGLGFFEIYPEEYGPQYLNVIPGHIFVRMFSLVGGLKNIATPEQAAAITPKPALSIFAATPAKHPAGQKSTATASYTMLSLPRGMEQSYGEVLSKFYAEIQATAKARYKVDVTGGALFNSGYLGLTFQAKGHKFNLYRGSVGTVLKFGSTDFKNELDLSADVEIALVKAKEIFYSYLANPRVTLNVGEKRDLTSKDYTKFENCVVAELLPTGIILHIKKDVSQVDLLRFDGFEGNEAFFKYEGPFNSYGTHRMLIGYRDGKTWSYTWGQSTSLVSDSVWHRNRVVVAAMEKLTGKLIYTR